MRLIQIAVEEDGALVWGPSVFFRAQRAVNQFVESWTNAWNEMVLRAQPLLDILVPMEEATDETGHRSDPPA